MKSTMLAIVITMFVSALYSFQNLDVVKVRFLFGEWNFPQGVWEIVLFCAGVILMWVFSVFAGLETRSKYKKQFNELNDKLLLAEEDKKNLLASVAALKDNMTANMYAADTSQNQAVSPDMSGESRSDTEKV